ncbi:hypothetical protein EW146_g3217, partial [Bondarzewia mesenterica]
MADDEDDYLSDKFVVEATAPPPQPKSYAERRREALKLSKAKNEQNRSKSRRQRELESREEGLSKSLFERAAEQEASGSGSQNKALAMMLKMGFKPGQSLGKVDDDGAERSKSPVPSSDREDSTELQEPPSETKTHQSRVEPLPLNEWAGRKGIGLGKRVAAPTDIERVTKVAKVEEESNQASFRDRARQDFEQRRMEGKLVLAQHTCSNLDEKAGKKFNILWLNPAEPESFPEGLLDALADASFTTGVSADALDVPIQERLRSQMRADALQPLEPRLDDDHVFERKTAIKEAPPSDELVNEAAMFLRSSSKDRLEQVVGYLRLEYCYCFWCGAQYESEEEMEQQCPGTDEDAHD